MDRSSRCVKLFIFKKFNDCPTDDSVKSNYELLLDEQSRKLQSTINRALCRVLKISIDTTKVNSMTITAPGKK